MMMSSGCTLENVQMFLQNKQIKYLAAHKQSATQERVVVEWNKRPSLARPDTAQGLVLYIAIARERSTLHDTTRTDAVL